MDVIAPHPRVAVVVLSADTGTIDPTTNTTARSVPSKTHTALCVIVEKRMFPSFLQFVVLTTFLARKHHGAFFFVAIGTLTIILSSEGLMKDNLREVCDFPTLWSTEQVEGQSADSHSEEEAGEVISRRVSSFFARCMSDTRQRLPIGGSGSVFFFFSYCNQRKSKQGCVSSLD